MKVIKGNLRSTRTTLPGQAKGLSSPRLHSQQWQAVDTGGKARRPGWHAVWSFPNLPCLPPEDKLPMDSLTCPGAVVPGACSSALEGCPPLLSPSWALQTNTCTGSIQTTCTYKQLNLHFVLNTFPSTLHSYQEGGFAPLITANWQEQTLPKTIWFLQGQGARSKITGLQM